MKIKHSKYIIIGAGLSGLTTAYKLKKSGEEDFLVLEGRSQFGGRICTYEGIELGATWFQEHHTYLRALLEELNMQNFHQYTSGQSVLVYNSMAPAHYFEVDKNTPSASRIAGGSIILIEKLSGILKDKIVLNSRVTEFIDDNDKVVLNTDENSAYSAEKVIVTIPPKLTSTLKFEPELPKHFIEVMKQTHTWMSNAIKVGLTFDTPFWRHKKFSGTVIGQIGPVTELYDHCSANDKIYALKGFVNEGLRDVLPEVRKERILSYLESYLGKEVRLYTNYFEKDWSQDHFTSCENLKSVYMSPHYGNEFFNRFYMQGKLFFSGTETSPVHGGYLDGAVYSGLRAAGHILNN
ncbi:flavin monoamine oxidase family protein [Flavivirga algicola]|uniref:NAD(P)-binding protein n=1 Tax=Flavivirga algicola TaxID=2729136 RepID=A0ABX1RWM4_9FLAO|nr:FAD-dependent oxidoreductase [Flavivirga algicola]NMH86740.1 NAD(P)-binding protein [Flavivirga algicola]